MEGLVLRVLALRPTPGKSDSPLPAREATLEMAGVLALTDPASVRSMLQTLEPTAETIEDRATWLRAWALADPRHAAELAEKELAQAKLGRRRGRLARRRVGGRPALDAFARRADQGRFARLRRKHGSREESRNPFGYDVDDVEP